MGFPCVASMIAAVTGLALWGVLSTLGVAEVSWQEIATSDVLPLGVVFLLRGACAAVAFYTLLRVYRDHEGLHLRYLEAQVQLRGSRRWSTFTLWCFTLLGAYFALATFCSGLALLGRGPAVPTWVLMSTLILFEVSYPMSLLVTAVVTFVLIPVARQHHYPIGRMFRWRPLLLHNGNVIMMQLAMLSAPPPALLVHLPYAVLFGCSYLLFAWWWFRRTGVLYYFFLDYRRPCAVVVYLGLLVTLAVLYGGGCLMAVLVRQEESRWWTYPCIILLTLGITRWREPGAPHPSCRPGTASP